MRPPSATATASAITRSQLLLPRSSSGTPVIPLKRAASTNSTNTDWVEWAKRDASAPIRAAGERGKALLFAGLGSYPHTPYSPTPSSLRVWEEASDALLSPDATIGYETSGMKDVAASVKGVHAWMRNWVEGRTLDQLMKRPDVTAAFILTSSVAILASAQEHASTPSLLPPNTTHLAGHGFIGTLTALVAAGRLDLSTGVRLARIYASLPASPRGKSGSYLTTVLSARHFHSLSNPSFYVPPPPSPSPNAQTEKALPPLSADADSFSDGAESSSAPAQRRRAMQLILDEIHAMEKEWENEGARDWAEAGIINSSKVVVVTGTHHAVLQVIERLQQLNLANPVMDVEMPCPYHTRLMRHAIPKFQDVLERCTFSPSHNDGPIILDPMTTHPIEQPSSALLPHLTGQLRWHKTLWRLYTPPDPDVSLFQTIGKGAKGLGIMLRGEIKKRPHGAPPIGIEEFGVKEEKPRRGSSATFVG